MAIFSIDRLTLGAQLDSGKFVDQVEIAAPDMVKKYPGTAFLLGRLLAATKDMQFDEDELAVPEIASFAATWKNRAEKEPKELLHWFLWELDGSLTDAWTAAYERANKPLISNTRLAKDKLSPKEREAADDPANPSPGGDTALSSNT